MSIYTPKPGTLRPMKRTDGLWEIHDEFGFFDGPYEDCLHCREVITREEREWSGERATA